AVTLEARARNDLSQNLEQGVETLSGLRALQRSLFRAQCQVVAQSPRLKAVVATQDISRETIVDVAKELQEVIESDLFVITDGSGQLIVDTAAPEASGQGMSNLAEIRGALRDGDASGLWTSGNRIFQVHAQRLSFGETVVGVLVVGFENEDWISESVYRQTGCHALVEFNDEIVTTSESTADALRTLHDWPTGNVGERLVGGNRVLAQAVNLPEYHGDGQLRYILVRSLDDALSTTRRLTWMIYGIAAGVLLLALVLAWVLVRRVSRPLDLLVDHTREIGEGALQAKVFPQAPVELQELGDAMNRMVQELAQSREKLGAQERQARELEIASKIQTSILPKVLNLQGFVASAAMIPAAEVGGDYYDILPAANGFWVGIGDVAGHGLPAGLVMMMLQSCVATATMPGCSDSPAAIVAQVNVILHNNIRLRLEQDEFVTFTLLRFYNDGRVVYAGAHEELVIYRAAKKTCERVITPGTWLGVYEDIHAITEDRSLDLGPGDMLVLYTDGVTEARNQEGEFYGMDRLCHTTEEYAQEGPEAIRKQIVKQVHDWQANQEDDISVVVLQRMSV
ncbi:MAG: PP2C family protein-serine/threonine phosphatase, partial [Nannocystaceae bacterium]